MSAPVEVALDVKIAAFAAITGNASGTTPMQSAWIRLINADTVAFTLTTAASTSGVWTAQVATDYLGSNPVDLPNPPTWPTGVNQSSTVTVTMPNERRYTHLQLTFTPSAGNGAVLANTGVVIGRSVKMERHTRSACVYFATPSTDTIAGQWAMEYSPTHFDRERESVPQIDNIADPQVWTAAVDSSNTAISIAATVTGGQNLIKRLGVFEPAAVRVKFTPTSGAGRVRAILNSKT